MYRIMYLSRAVVRFSDEELEELLLKARQNNSKRNVTGLLILKGRSFLQCLEGKKEDVLAIFEKIKNDSRHDSLVEVIEEEDSKRYFPNWYMGYKTINELDEVRTKKLIDFSEAKNINAFSHNDISEIFKEFIEVK